MGPLLNTLISKNKVVRPPWTLEGGFCEPETLVSADTSNSLTVLYLYMPCPFSTQFINGLIIQA